MCKMHEPVFKKKIREAISACSLMPHSHQGLNTFKTCLVEHSLKLFPSFIKAAFGFLLATEIAQMEA